MMHDFKYDVRSDRKISLCPAVHPTLYGAFSSIKPRTDCPRLYCDFSSKVIDVTFWGKIFHFVAYLAGFAAILKAMSEG